MTILWPESPLWLRMIAASLTAMATTALFLSVTRRLLGREIMMIPIVGLVLSGCWDRS